jgi:hypothetical protein
MRLMGAVMLMRLIVYFRALFGSRPEPQPVISREEFEQSLTYFIEWDGVHRGRVEALRSIIGGEYDAVVDRIYWQRCFRLNDEELQAAHLECVRGFAAALKYQKIMGVDRHDH